MKLYYYTYETTVFRPFFDTEYDLEDGYLIEGPLGIIQVFESYEANVFEDIKDFKKHIQFRQPRNFGIVELK